ncbi:hypothetical protein FRZ67_20665 [Panacibacter ginsenosidivorans]|uniref:VCBS repeat-containing protein n=1 Tax=Panacibacter ginsenosidivorans TaxID=1813871 RepID=A0A5B8VG94_9BACT|nr:hypothetical protein [Panacibacter ginsenosidivorans]QEC69596.1 hypothetical protein FRZ67_20665 [Panacibacter ginsenosidivorans]
MSTKHLLLLLFMPFIFTSSFGQENSIPKQYRPVKEIYGDLNKDSVDEKIVVYNVNDTEDEVEGVDREIIIFKKENRNWVIWHRSKTAIGNSKDGGMMGDPFEGIEIKNGILLVYESGGSSWKWSFIDKYRFQNNNFELIGYVSSAGKVCEYWQDVDYNISTGEIIIKKEYEDCDKAQEIYKRENEEFVYKLKNKITLENRDKEEIKIISPKYKHEIYL